MGDFFSCEEGICSHLTIALGLTVPDSLGMFALVLGLQVAQDPDSNSHYLHLPLSWGLERMKKQRQESKTKRMSFFLLHPFNKVY